MRIAVLGAGAVGQRLAGKLRDLGHDVAVGTRAPREGAVSYGEAAEGAEVVFNATNGEAALDALDAAGAENLSGKLLIDVSNLLVFRQGEPPAIGVAADDQAQAVELLGSFGWPRERIIDLGDITAARGAELYVALWFRLLGALGTPHFNIAIRKAQSSRERVARAT